MEFHSLKVKWRNLEFLLLVELTVVEPADMNHLNPRAESTSMCTPLQTIRYSHEFSLWE